MQQSLGERFSALAASDGGDVVSAVAIEASGSHLLAKGAGGEPILLIRSELRQSPRVPLRLKHVSVAFDEAFEVRLESKAPATVGSYTKLACAARSASLHPWFIELAQAVTEGKSAPMSASDVDALLDSLIELFRRPTQPEAQTILGLWGELFAIDSSTDPSRFVRGWRTQAHELFDFDLESMRVEVKTTLRQERSHEFALNQVRPALPTHYVLSLQTRRATSGPSAFALARRISSKVSAAARERLWRLVLEALGPEIDGVDEHCFDEALASTSMRLYPCDEIPAPEVSPAHSSTVSNVRFIAHLSGLGNGVPLSTVSLKSAPHV